VREFEKSLLRFMDQTHPEIEADITKNTRISDETEPSLRAAVDEFKKTFAG
jgi:F-type H+/Na+-transporting ATPase subunit alpha